MVSTVKQCADRTVSFSFSICTKIILVCDSEKYKFGNLSHNLSLLIKEDKSFLEGRMNLTQRFLTCRTFRCSSKLVHL